VSAFKLPNFNERKNAAAEARKTALEKFKAGQTAADDPALLEKQAAKQASRIARDQRAAERKAAREAEKLAEITAREAAVEAERLAKEREIEDEAARAITLKNDQKAARDARYAARKARRN